MRTRRSMRSRTGGGSLPPVPGTVTVGSPVRVDDGGQRPSFSGTFSYVGSTLNGGTRRVECRVRVGGAYGSAFTLVALAMMSDGFYSQGQNVSFDNSFLQFRVVIAKGGTDYIGIWNDGAGGPESSEATFAPVDCVAFNTVANNGCGFVENTGFAEVDPFAVTFSNPEGLTAGYAGWTVDFRASNVTVPTDGTPVTTAWGTQLTAGEVRVTALVTNSVNMKAYIHRAVIRESGGTATVDDPLGYFIVVSGSI